MRFNPAVARLTAPPVAVVQQWISQYDGSKGALIDLSQAVPGYPAHDDMLAALGSAAADPSALSYGPIEGEDTLRQAYASHCSNLYTTSVDPGEVMITAGCNQAFILAALTVAGAGDDVLMLRPCYFNHSSTLGMAGINVTWADTLAEDSFMPDPEVIRAAITPGTRAIALVSPNNPTGAIYPDDVMQAIMDICVERDIWLILDETYRDCMPSDEPPHHLLNRDGWQDRLILLYSFSKAYAIPGHRLGAAIAGRATIAEMAKVMDNIQVCAPRAAQIATAPMIAHLADWREANRVEMVERGKAFQAAFAQLNGWHIASMGAYFGLTRHPFEMTSAEAAEYLMRETGVLTIPGGFFGDGQEGFLRIAFANASVDEINQLAGRLGGSGR